MKRFILHLALASSLAAAPLYLTFEGVISNVDVDQTGLVAQLGLGVDSPVRYVFAIDTARQGYVEFLPGQRLEIPDSTDPDDSSRTNSFFDSLILPATFGSVSAGLNGESFAGLHTTSGAGNTLQIEQSYAKDGAKIFLGLSVYDSPTPVPDSGSSFTGSETYIDKAGKLSQLSVMGNLVQITDKRGDVGIRPGRPLAGRKSAWVRAGLAGDALQIRNFSGRRAQAWLLDGRGRLLLARPVGETAVIALDGLPKGFYLLRVTAPGTGDRPPFTQGFLR